MKKTTIENIYSTKKTMFNVKITLLCCAFLVFIFISYIALGHSSFFSFIFGFFIIGFFILQQYDLFFRLREVYRFLKKDRQTETEILWWNYDDIFLTDEKIIIYSSNLEAFQYSDIKSIQKERYAKKNSEYPLIDYYLHINLKDDTHYKILMYSNYSRAAAAYDDIEDITNLLLEKNPNIIVEKQIDYNPFKESSDKK